MTKNLQQWADKKIRDSQSTGIFPRPKYHNEKKRNAQNKTNKQYQNKSAMEYHRIKDPALKRYYKSVPVRKRLETLGLITEEDKNLCSAQEFATLASTQRYLENIDRLQALENVEGIKSFQKSKATLTE